MKLDLTRLIQYTILLKIAQSAREKNTFLLNVLELFCGRGGWSKPFLNNGHKCTGIDIKNFGYPGKFIQADLMDYEPQDKFDVIFASPPCSEFSEVKRNCGHPYDERQGLDLVYRAFYLIKKLKPRWFILENVKGLAEFIGEPNQKIRYGKSRKYAYLWTNIGNLGFFDYDFSDYKRDKLYHGKMSGWEACKTGVRGEIPKTLANEIFKKIS
jgi:site-specific DNA-cytosine methylase